MVIEVIMDSGDEMIAEHSQSRHYDDDVPWIEKYRPQTLDDLASHSDIKSTLEKFMKDSSLPHLLFYGPPGTGKTSTILACAKKLYEPQQFGQMVLELNASDDRGIDIVRGQILNFASSRGIYPSRFKLVILDEADQMTNDAQNALRRIIEKYTENTRFCLITNYLNKITPAIQSRCTRFRFGPLKAEQVNPRVNFIIEREGLRVTNGSREAILNLCQGDMRRIVNLLQSVSLAYSNQEIDENKVYQCCGQPLKSDIKMILKTLCEKDTRTAIKELQQFKLEKGIALQDIITQISFQLPEFGFKKAKLQNIYKEMANLEFYLNSGGSEKIYLSALIALFANEKSNTR